MSPLRQQPKTGVALGTADGFESVNAEVVEANSRHDGTPNFQSEMIFTLGQQLGNTGRARTIVIRGPFRPDKQAAQDDADKLLQVAQTEGMQKVRQMATAMKRSTIR